MWLRIKATGQGIDIINLAVAQAMLDGGTAEKIEPRGKKVETASVRPPQNAAVARPSARVAHAVEQPDAAVQI